MSSSHTSKPFLFFSLESSISASLLTPCLMFWVAEREHDTHTIVLYLIEHVVESHVQCPWPLMVQSPTKPKPAKHTLTGKKWIVWREVWAPLCLSMSRHCQTTEWPNACIIKPHSVWGVKMRGPKLGPPKPTRTSVPGVMRGQYIMQHSHIESCNTKNGKVKQSRCYHTGKTSQVLSRRTDIRR